MEFENKLITELSGGELQRVLLGKALMQEPEVLILDEPASHLDIKHQLALYRLLKKLNTEKNMTMIIISHDINLTMKYCSQVFLLKTGEIKYKGSPKDVITPENLREIFEINTELINLEGEKNQCVIIKN